MIFMRSAQRCTRPLAPIRGVHKATCTNHVGSVHCTARIGRIPQANGRRSNSCRVAAHTRGHAGQLLDVLPDRRDDIEPHGRRLAIVARWLPMGSAGRVCCYWGGRLVACYASCAMGGILPRR
jgi:hypothetical protein